MIDETIVGYHCTFCGIWYEATEVFQCIRCKEYKGLVPVTKQQWELEDWSLDNLGT